MGNPVVTSNRILYEPSVFSLFLDTVEIQLAELVTVSKARCLGSLPDCVRHNRRRQNFLFFALFAAALDRDDQVGCSSPESRTVESFQKLYGLSPPASAQWKS